MKSTIRAAALVGAAVLALAACADSPDGGPTGTARDTFKACMVSSAGGFEDGSFNQSGREGLERAHRELGVEVETAESQTEADYAPNIGRFVADGCDLVIGVGALLEPAVHKAATDNPDVAFALVDSAFTDGTSTVPVDNARPILFDTAQASYLAGYLAAGTSQTGTVATFGGMQIPSVTIFMDGFADGVDRYNQDHGTTVTVLGWDKPTQTGQFVGSFEDTATAQAVTAAFLDDGADVILPVAGGAGRGAPAAITTAGSSALVVGVDEDWTVSNPESAAITLTSVLKEVGQAVYDTVRQAAASDFDAEPYVGTLKNGGVGLAPFHELVPADLASSVTRLERDLVDGKITVLSPATPR